MKERQERDKVPGYGRVFPVIMNSCENPTTIAVYAALTSLRGFGKITICDTTLAKMIKTTRQAVAKSIRELEANAVIIQRRSHPKGPRKIKLLDEPVARDYIDFRWMTDVDSDQEDEEETAEDSEPAHEKTFFNKDGRTKYEVSE